MSKKTHVEQWNIIMNGTDLFHSPDAGEERKTQLTAALLNYQAQIIRGFERKKYLKMIVPSLSYMAVGIKLAFRTLRGDYKK